MSKKYQLNKEDLTKIGVGALVAIGGALLAYLTPLVSQIDWTIGGQDFTPIAVAVFSIIINFARKFLSGY